VKREPEYNHKYYTVNPENWGTNKGCECHAHLRRNERSFVPQSGRVNCGPTWPLETDFTELTPQQLHTLKRENLYWAHRQALQQDTLETWPADQRPALSAWRDYGDELHDLRRNWRA
jgi:hypothetical protein